MLPLEHSAILLTLIKLPFVIKIFVLSIFEWPFYTGFTELAAMWILSSLSLPLGAMVCDCGFSWSNSLVNC